MNGFSTLLFSTILAVGTLAAADPVIGPYRISESNGSIVSGGALKNCQDSYRLSTRTGELSGNEGFDRVTAVKTEDNRLELTCVNDEMGLAIDKIYTYDPERGILNKTVAVSGPAGFWEFTSGVKVDPKFRSGAYYHKPVWHSADPARIPARSVSRAIPQVGFISLVNLVNPAQDKTLSVYRSQVNDQPVFPYGGVGAAKGGLTLNRNGWEQVNALDAIVPDKTASVTVSYELSDGDEFDFYGEFVARPEILDFRGADAEGWARNLIAEGGWDLSYLNQLPQLQQLSARLPWETVYAWTLWGWFAPYYGDYAYDRQDAAVGTQDPVKTRDLFAELRGKLPAGNIKLGCYILPGALNQSAKVTQEHPEWLNYQLDGTPVSGCYADYAPADPTFAYSIRRGALPHWRDRIAGILREIQADYLYIDGGIAGAVIPDWQSMSCDQDPDWYELWRAFQELCQESGGVILSNQSASVYNDGGYHEFNWYPTYAQDWRAFTDRVKTAVIFRGADRRVALVGYVWSGKAEDPATRLAINSYFTLNTYASFLDNKGDQHFRAVATQLPYLLAAFELFPSEVATDARVTPDWRDEANEMEVHAFRFGGGGRLGLLNHSANPSAVSVSVSTRELGLKANLPLYVWTHKLLPQPDETRQLAGKAELPTIFHTELTAVTEKTPETYSCSVTLEQELAGVMILSNSPVLLTFVDGQQLPLPLPAALGVTTSGIANAADRAMIVGIDSEKFSGEALVLLPEFMPEALAATIQPTDAAANAVAAGPQPWAIEHATHSGRRALRIAFPAGRHNIVIAAKK